MQPEKTQRPIHRWGRFFRSPLFPIFMIVFVDVLGVGITIPVLPLYAQEIFSASATQITLLVSVFFAAQFLASPRLGRLSDRVGRRPVLILSQTGTLSALLLSGLAPSLRILYLARVIDGITGGNVSVAQAYLSDVTGKENRARGMGIINAAFSSGFIFGPAFGGFVAAQFGPRIPFFFAAVISVITISLSIFLLPQEPPVVEHHDEGVEKVKGEAPPGDHSETVTGKTSSPLLRNPGVLLLLLIGFGGQFAFFNFQSTFVLWAEAVIFSGQTTQYVQQAVGLVLTVVGLFGIATQLWLVGPLVSRLGEKRMISSGLASRAFTFLVMSLFPFLVPVLVVIPLLSVGGGISRPALMALMTFSAPSHRQGYAMGLLEAAMGLGRIMGPLFGGALFQYLSPNAPNAMAAGILTLTVLATFGLRNLELHKTEARAN